MLSLSLLPAHVHLCISPNRTILGPGRLGAARRVFREPQPGSAAPAR